MSRTKYAAILFSMAALVSAHAAAASWGYEPAITSIHPDWLRPQGGDVVTITGSSFGAPARVWIGAREAFVMSVTATQIVIVTPPADLGANQYLPVDVRVTVRVGTSSEATATVTHGATYTSSVLKPSITAIAPAIGPITGGTRVAIIGDAFEAPVQVFFGGSEAQVIRLTMTEVDVISPERFGVDDVVDVKVINIASAMQATFPQAFRYSPRMTITAFGPASGPSTGGTRIEIDGSGFWVPVVVLVAGVAAHVESLTPTEIVAVTTPVMTHGCANVSGPIEVINLDSGESVQGAPFTYVAVHPTMLSIEPSVLFPGTTFDVTASNAGAASIRVGDYDVVPSSIVTNADGTTTFTLMLPDVVAATRLPLTLSNPSTGCTTTQTIRIRGEVDREARHSR